MASSGPGGAQQRRRPGPSWGKGRGTFNKGSGDGGGRGAAQKKAEPGGVYVQRKSVQRGEKDKKRWKSAQQINAGSTKEGQGFALWRKQKVQLEYKKLQRKQKKTTAPKDLYADNYPEHLKHLYLAEEERLKSLERKRKPEEDITQTTKEDITQTTDKKNITQTTEKEIAQTTEERVEEVPKKKFKNKTSIQKAKDEYKRVQNERANKRKEAEENRRQREEAKELYKKRKMEAFKVLSAKTKKGQPNFNVQMEYLLKKIQSKT